MVRWMAMMTTVIVNERITSDARSQSLRTGGQGQPTPIHTPPTHSQTFTSSI